MDTIFLIYDNTRNIDTCSCPIISHIDQCRAYSSVLVTQVHHVVIKLTNNVPHLDTDCTVECFYRYSLERIELFCNKKTH